MEDLKLIMDDILKNREEIKKISDITLETINQHNYLVQTHNNSMETIASANVRLVKKHNKLCKAVKGLCFVCLGLDVLIFLNTIEISKLKAELNKEKENKEG